ncbi:hypothetical protein [Streptomyces sp. NPDC058308]|uniref:hypothetical protein n=1 Tax=Streptomyces sp. NPDC058308 TaxID=3346440 RepID=UPI0036EACFE9
MKLGKALSTGIAEERPSRHEARHEERYEVQCEEQYEERLAESEKAVPAPDTEQREQAVREGPVEATAAR